jgi:hypothetical protein
MNSTDTPPRGNPTGQPAPKASKPPRIKPNPERDSSIQYLCDVCPPGTTVYTQLAHVSRSGMQKQIRVFVVADGEIRNITHHVARAIQYRLKLGSMHDAIIVGGCGFDAGFDIVQALSYTLHGLPTQDNTAPCGPNLNKPRAGYTLRHEWL